MAIKTKLHKFGVLGRGSFPVDMLRYDCCWPASAEDASKLLDREAREIVLYSYQEPTIARWSSFGWNCSQTSWRV